MKAHAADLVIALLLLIALYKGYKAGLLATLFSVIGYIGGGLAALLYTVDFVRTWHNNFQKYALIILAIVIGASIGQAIFHRIGKFFHNKILFAPLTWIDSLLGAVLSVLRSAFFIYIFVQLSLAMPWSWAHQYLPQSTIVAQLHKSAPGILKSAVQKASNLHSFPTANPLE